MNEADFSPHPMTLAMEHARGKCGGKGFCPICDAELEKKPRLKIACVPIFQCSECGSPIAPAPSNAGLDEQRKPVTWQNIRDMRYAILRHEFHTRCPYSDKHFLWPIVFAECEEVPSPG